MSMDRQTFQKLLAFGVERAVSDIHFEVGYPPHYCLHGELLGAIKVHNNIYNGVLRIVYDGNKVSFEPELAEAWEMKSDTDHVFRIREGVTFHNGDPLTAKDIKWSFERVANRERRLPDAYLAEGQPGVTSAFLEYGAPLLGPPPPARFRLG